jgi:hypothetical protein
VQISFDQLFFVDNGFDNGFQPDIGPAFVKDPVADDNAFFRTLVGKDGDPIGTNEFMPVVRMDILFDGSADDIIHLVAENGVYGRGEVPDGAINGVYADDIFGVLRQQPELLFAVEQGIFRFFLESDILGDPEFHLFGHHFSFYGQIAHPALFGDDAAGEGSFIAGVLFMLDGFGEFFRYPVKVFRDDIRGEGTPP